MPWFPKPDLDSAVDRFLFRLSVYAVPALVALFSLWAFFALETHYPYAGARQLPIFVWAADGADSPAQALRSKAAPQPFTEYRTGRSEAPIWFSFTVAPRTGGSVVELPSRHALDARCWIEASLESLGQANRMTTSGAMRQAKAGFAIDLQAGAELAILCRATHTGPAHVSAIQWTPQEFALSELKFHRNSGLLDGGLIVLALFVLTTAIVSREWLYVLFSVWLVANLRLAALSAGWDTQWLELRLPPDVMVPLRKLSMSMYYVLTIMLFSRLFADELRQIGRAGLLRLMQWSCLPLLAAAAVLPYAPFLPVLWTLTAVSTTIILVLLVRILMVTRSMVAVWYGAGLAVALAASLNEVVAAALGFRTLIGSVNSVTAALASSLLSALAIAEQIRLERAQRRHAQDELRNTYNAIPVGLFSLDEQGTLVQCNPAYQQMTGGRIGEAWEVGFEAGAFSRLRGLAEGRAGEEMEIGGQAADGKAARRFLVKATQSNGRIEGSLQDVTLRVEATDKLRFLANHDPLTGILNRRGIERSYDAMHRDREDRQAPALAYIDLDRFKLINDLFGHVAGDAVLRNVCNRIGGILAPDDIFGRVGGDEFVIVFRSGPLQSNADTCRRIIDDISSAPFVEGERAFQVKCSIGLVEIAPGMLEDDAVSLADRACREAKTRHDRNLVVYDRGTTALNERKEELRLIQRLDSAKPEGLFLVMQPIMSLRDPFGSLNFEVLLRMRDDDGSIIPAWRVVTAAERNGRIATIDKWVLATTLEWLEANARSLKNCNYVSINLSGGSLNDERFIADAFAILARHGRTVEKLCIEITESVALHDLTNTRTFIDGIRKHGARLALDDFGAGYTSFSYLRSLPADAVKIDGAYVKDLLAHPANAGIVQAIVDLTRNLGMKCIAEWAEDTRTLEALAEMGVDYVQGYVVSRPLMPEEILLLDSSGACIKDPNALRFVRADLPQVFARAGQSADLRYN